MGLLLERCGYQVDCRDSSGVTPVMDAARGDHVAVLQSLLRSSKVRPKILNWGREVGGECLGIVL